MTGKRTPEEIQQMLTDAIDYAHIPLFERFDIRFRVLGVNDDGIIRGLRGLDQNDLANDYIEWSGAIDPDLEDDNTTTSPDGVTDPGTNPSDLDMQAAHEQRTHAGHVQTVFEAIKAQLLVERERDLYFDENYDGESAMLDGPVNLLDLAEAVVKGLGK